MGNVPGWLVTWLVSKLMELLTPEAVEKLETMAKEFVVAQLRAFAKTTPGKLDDSIVEKVAEALGVK